MATLQIELIPQAAGGGGAGGGPGGARTLSSGVRISGERGGPRVVQVRAEQSATCRACACTSSMHASCTSSMLPYDAACRSSQHPSLPAFTPLFAAPTRAALQVTRHFQLAAGGGSRNVRGRGSVRGGPRGGPSAMQE